MNPKQNKARLARLRQYQATVAGRKHDAARREAERLAVLAEQELQDTVQDLIFAEEADKPENAEGDW